MRHIFGTIRLLSLLTPAACLPTVQLTPPAANAPAAQVALSGASIFIGAGDIAGCGQNNDQLTAMLVDSLLKADSIAKVNDAVFTAGDNVYDSGTPDEFLRCFTPTWGDPTKRIMKKIHPSPGNHEYLSPAANGYYAYFGAAAGAPDKGYYSYTVGTWHVVALNSEMFVNFGFSQAQRTEQLAWLVKDLTTSPKACTIAYFHHPRFSSGYHGSDVSLAPVWTILYEHNVDLVLNGHDHDYERFVAQNPDAQPDSVRGIPEIIVGTGGEELRGFGGKRIKNSVMQVEGRAGILLLTLGAAEYRSVFMGVTGGQWDASGGKCH
jgi:hypothetical protein